MEGLERCHSQDYLEGEDNLSPLEVRVGAVMPWRRLKPALWFSNALAHYPTLWLSRSTHSGSSIYTLAIHACPSEESDTALVSIM